MRFRYLFQNNVTIIKQEIDSVFVIPEIIKVSVSVVTASAISSAEVASAYVGRAYGIFARVGDVSEIEWASAANTSRFSSDDWSSL